MPELNRTWYFEPRSRDEDDDGGEAGHGDGDHGAASGLPFVPDRLLQRHGARVLDPANAAVVSGGRPPAPTVYRARTLLIPADLIQDFAVVKAINAVLADVGMNIVVPKLDRRPPQSSGRAGEVLRWLRRPRSSERAGEVLRQLPRPVVLVPAAPEPGRPARPVVIDAWTALQALRSAAAAAEDDTAVLSKRVVRRIALEHLLVGSGITGSPSHDPHGGGSSLPGGADSYVYSGGDTRAPVAVCLDPPARRSLKDCGSRRPVVAVLDTGVRAHPWLDVEPDSATGYQTVPDGFVAVDHLIQKAIRLESEAAASRGDEPRQLIKGAWDKPVTEDPLIGELDTASGHGSFIAGIVRQVAPDAQVLAVRIMHSDDVVYEGDLICALGLLAERVAFAQTGHMEKMVDVISLSLGYFDESADDVHYSSGLWRIIELLLSMGVAVVASAGNSSTSRRCYPAAFALLPQPDPVHLISVGALNPNGTKALFSNDGRWVRAWAAGAAVVSTFPVDIDASRTPQIRVRAHPSNGMRPVDREALDPDNYQGGFATWSGTSFSAPLLAARIAAQLLRDGAALDAAGEAAARDRMVAALKKMGWQG